MITEKSGDFFDTTQPALGHGVNCRADMSGGVAAKIKKKHPEVFSAYKNYCKTVGLHGGELFVTVANDNRIFLNLASQEKPGRNARYEWVEESFVRTLQYCRDHSISGFALPKIASDIGGLEWDKVYEILKTAAQDFPEVEVEVWAFVPQKS